MLSTKRTATEARLPMPSPKRPSTGRRTNVPDRTLVPHDEEGYTGWISAWTAPIIAKGKGYLWGAMSSTWKGIRSLWSGPLLPIADRHLAKLPSRPSRARLAPASPPNRSGQHDELPSDSSGQESPPTPQERTLVALPGTNAHYGPFQPRPPPREFAIPKSEVAEKMTEPIVKTDAMRRAEESERKQRGHVQWVLDYQRRLRAKQALNASPGEPGGVRKAYKKPHIFQAEFDAQARDGLLRALYEQSKNAGFTQDYSSFKELADYKERLKERLKDSAPPSVASTRGEEALSVANDVSAVFSESPFRRSLRIAREAALSRPLLHHFAQWYDEEIKRRLEARARKEAEEAARIAALAKKTVPTDLTEDEKAEVARTFKKPGQVNECGKETINHDSIERLRGTTWLNDEVVNFYGAMIQQRTDERLKAAGGKPGQGGKDLPDGTRALDIHIFNSFFYTKLINEGYAKARIGRWTKKFDIFKKDKIIFPMNIGGMHWTTGCIDFRRKRIEWYDSLSGPAGQIFDQLRKYLDLEHREKHKKPFDFTGWVDYRCPDYPQQQNGSDCGVFTCLGMEALARDADFNFEQVNIPFFRRLMVLEIGRGKLKEIATRD